MRHPHLADACLAEPGQSRQQLVASHGADSGRGSTAGIAGLGYGISSNARPFGHMEDPSRCGPSVGTVSEASAPGSMINV